MTGLRRGELCGLRNDDIENGILTIRRSINSDLEETPCKNDNARRTIELTNIALSVLEKQRAMLKDSGIISPWVFPDSRGERSNPQHVYSQWRTWGRQHGIESSIHEMRHTFISLNKADLPLELVKAVVGHSSQMDTFGVYGHEVEGDRHRAAQIIDNVFRNVLGNS